MARRKVEPDVSKDVAQYISTMAAPLIKLTLMVGAWGKSAPRSGPLTDGERKALSAERARRMGRAPHA
jgi:hypothetical protein